MLETLQRLADIAQKGVVAIALAFGGYLLSREQANVTIGKSCDEMFSKILDFVSANTLTDRTNNLVDYRLETYGKACGALSEDRLRYIKSSWKPSQGPVLSMLVDAMETHEPPAAARLGWVATGRIPPQRYSDTNFDRLDKPQASVDEVGAIIEPRWQVNVRKTNTSVTGTNNPIVGQVAPGECLKVVTAVKGQLNTWAEVAPVTCPANRR